jgi:hypothetical protein
MFTELGYRHDGLTGRDSSLVLRVILLVRAVFGGFSTRVIKDTPCKREGDRFRSDASEPVVTVHETVGFT